MRKCQVISLNFTEPEVKYENTERDYNSKEGGYLMTPATFSLRELRARKGKTQRQAAADLGVSTATYCHWEQDLSQTAFINVKALASYFGVSLDQIAVRPGEQQ